MCNDPDRKGHEVNMGPTWVLLAPGGPHVGPINFAIRGGRKKAGYNAISLPAWLDFITWKNDSATDFHALFYTGDYRINLCMSGVFNLVCQLHVTLLFFL